MKTKKIKILLISIVIILALISTTFTFAKSNESNAKVTLPTNLSQAYSKWQNLTDEEKQNSIMPQPYSVNISDFIRKSKYRMLTNSKVGANGNELQYNLYNDYKFKIKNQLNTNECWAFATTTALETNIYKMRNKDIELSPRHIDYATSKTFLDGINEKAYNREIGFGNIMIALGYCTSGTGPVLEKDMPFQNNENKVNLEEINKTPVLKVQDYVKFPNIYKSKDESGQIQYNNGIDKVYTENEVLEVRKQIKEHVKKYGGVTAYTHIGANFVNCVNIEKLNNGQANTIAYYNGDTNNVFDHAVTIVGWDDTYAVDNFNDNNKPKNPGAYIVLNSSSGENNAFSQLYISYDDVWIEVDDFGIINTTDIDYNKIYQYDEYGYDISLPLTDNQTNENVQVGYMANVFSREEKTNKDEYLNEISVYIPTISSSEVYINSENDDKTKLQKVAFSEILTPGYHTIKLTSPVKLTGSKFVVAVKLSADSVLIPTETNYKSNNLGTNFWDNAKASTGESFISLDGKKWNDLNTMIKDSNVCIKAFTTYQEKEKEIDVTNVKLNKTTLEMKEGEIITLVASLEPANATNKNVTWSSDNNEIVTITQEGIIKAMKEGTTTIKVTTQNGGKTAICNVTVKGKVNSDDNIYYPDDSSNIDNSQDSSYAPNKIPQTGAKVTLLIITIVLSASIILVYIKMRNLKEVK